MSKRLAVLAVIAWALGPSHALATFHTFIVDQLYSSADGEIQFIVLREAGGVGAQHLFAGQTVTSTRGGVVKTFTFPANLPSSATAGKRVLIASEGYVVLRNAAPSLNLPAPDYTSPNRFLATDGGVVDFAGVDQLSYASLPGDGTNARFRDGSTAANLAQNFGGVSVEVPVVPTLAVEYYHEELDHYFVSSLAPDIDALDSGRSPGWERTDEAYEVMPIASGEAPDAVFGPVCRFYIPPEKGDSHFFSASIEECADVLQRSMTDPNYTGYVYETPSAYFAALPNQVTGECPPETRPLYRLWNQRVDSNHRYTESATIKAEMIALGYVGEGYGPDTVAMCVL